MLRVQILTKKAATWATCGVDLVVKAPLDGGAFVRLKTERQARRRFFAMKIALAGRSASLRMK